MWRATRLTLDFLFVSKVLIVDTAGSILDRLKLFPTEIATFYLNIWRYLS